MSRRVHDAVARRYNSESGIIGEKNRLFFERLRTRLGRVPGPVRVLDLGVGDGALLARLAAEGLPVVMTGLDVSPAMLAKAAGRVPMTPVLARAEESSHHLPAGAFDLVLAHFVLAYVPAAALFREARQLLAPGGRLSVVATTTAGGAPFYAQLDKHFRSGWHPGRRAIGWAADRALARAHIPSGGEALAREAEAAGLAVLARETLAMPVRFDTPADAYRFGIDEGWAVGFMAVPLPLSFMQAVVRWGLAQCDYPFEVTQVIEVMEFGLAGEGVA
jgi:SAM-dependent methyltransferase